MERLEAAHEVAKKAHATFVSIFDEPLSPVVRDAAIQRFEYTFEATWKLLKTHLAAVEGVVCASPKSCFRAAFQAELLDEAETSVALEMTDDRNRTVHAYHEATAQRIFERLPRYRDLLGDLLERTQPAAE